MSGGAWNYAYRTIEDWAVRLQSSSTTGNIAARRAMVPHLERLAAAMKAVERVDSFDASSDLEAIQAFLDGLRVTSLDRAIEEARQTPMEIVPAPALTTNPGRGAYITLLEQANRMLDEQLRATASELDELKRQTEEARTARVQAGAVLQDDATAAHALLDRLAIPKHVGLRNRVQELAKRWRDLTDATAALSAALAPVDGETLEAQARNAVAAWRAVHGRDLP